MPTLSIASVGLVVAAMVNRRGNPRYAGWTAFLSVLLPTTLLVVQANDGFRSIAMLIFPGCLLICVMLLDRVAYMATAATIVLAVTALAVQIHGLTRAIPGARSATTYESILYVDLILLVFAAIGSGSRAMSKAAARISALPSRSYPMRTWN